MLATGEFSRVGSSSAHAGVRGLAAEVETCAPVLAPYIGSPVGLSFTSLAAADVNVDGFLDLVGASPLSGMVAVAFGSTNCTFQIHRTYTISGGPYLICCTRFDENEWPDAIVASGETGDIHVLLDCGIDNRSASSIQGPSHATALTLADVTGDSHVDVIVAWAGSNTISVFPGVGDGGVLEPQSIRVAGLVESIAVADLDKDGDPDIVVGRNTPPRLLSFYRDASGDYELTAELPSSGASMIEISDFTADGWVDIAVAGSTSSVLEVYANDLGRFTAERRQTYPAGLIPVSLTSGDFDGNKVLDLACVDAAGKELITYYMFGDGVPPRRERNTVSRSASGLTAGDFGGDGFADVAWSEGGSIAVNQSRGNRGLGADVIARLDHQGGTKSIEVVDVDNDGIQDLLTSSFRTPGISFLRGNGAGFSVVERLYDQKAIDTFRTSDLNSDGLTDILLISGHSDTLWYGIGIGDQVVPRLEGFPLSGVPSVVSTLTQRRADPPLLCLAYGAERRLEFGHFSSKSGFEVAQSITLSGSPLAVTPCDLNQDSLDDLVVTIGDVGPEGELCVFQQTRQGRFVSTACLPSGLSPQDVATGDLNGDGFQDVVTVCHAIACGYTFLGDGTGRVSFHRQFAIGMFPSQFVLVDINQDNSLDVIAGAKLGNMIYCALGDGTGGFREPALFGCGERPVAIAASEVIGGGAIDIVVGFERLGTLAILEGRDVSTSALELVVSIEARDDCTEVAATPSALSREHAFCFYREVEPGIRSQIGCLSKDEITAGATLLDCELESASRYWVKGISRHGSERWFGPYFRGSNPFSAGVSQILATPNPFRSETRFKPPSQTSRLILAEVFDPQGRPVYRQVLSPSAADGEGQFRWAGIDDTGRLLPGGAYFVRFVDIAGSVFTGKVIIAR